MKTTWKEIDANAHEALSRFHGRTGWEPVETRMPYAEMIEREDDGLDTAPGAYEFRQRNLGAKALLKFIKARGLHPAWMLKQLVAVGRALHEEPFASLSMAEAGLLMSETKAAHSWRCKLISGEIELAGMKASKLPGQKSKDATESYKKCRKGNKNRAGKKPSRKSPRGKNQQPRAFLRN